MAKKTLWVAVHHHRHGTDAFLFRTDHEPELEEVVTKCKIDFEPEREEYIDIDAVGDESIVEF
jgi:hypothetical protein